MAVEPALSVMLTASEADLILAAIDTHVEEWGYSEGDGELVLAMVTADKVRAVREALGG